MNGCRALSDQDIARILSNLPQLRDKVLFLMGLKTGYRISEMLSLRVSDIYQFGEIADRVSVQRRHMKQKTRGRTVLLHPELKAMLLKLIQEEGLLETSYLFRSRKGKNSPMGRIQAWRILKQAMIRSKVSGKVATHSMRKTFAQKVYLKLGRDLIRTQAALGHQNINSTVSYLSFLQSEIDDAILSL